ncbi:MAG TPA: hypothetical protein VGF32_24630 [Streptosporangiaceae bacterium]|jgi:hypothetical protein
MRAAAAPARHDHAAQANSRPAGGDTRSDGELLEQVWAYLGVNARAAQDRAERSRQQKEFRLRLTVDRLRELAVAERRARRRLATASPAARRRRQAEVNRLAEALLEGCGGDAALVRDVQRSA